ncbi:hypothetical protein BDZ89DRAFT_958055 [Hymenopellis radicata]|nr:hypothetical protein BDZ89DRAFT_958055 [Hymenopellis radicata]
MWLLRLINETSVEAALRQLVTVGIRFTFATIALTPLLATTLLSEAIPWRRFPFKATTVDYEEYLARRARLFSSTTVLRAALLSGGIIWRIAMEHSSDPASLLTTTAEEIQRIGSRAGLPNGDVVAQLSLTEEQRQIIIGTYRVSPTLPAPKDCPTVSWFPSATSFWKSGINVGFWSNDAESWYQLRVHNYIHGLKQPVAKGAWTTTMNLHQPAQRVARGYENRARKVLDAALS